MKNRKIFSLFLVFYFGFFYNLLSNEALKIVKKIDELYRAKSSYALLRMEIQTPHWKRELKLKIWTLGKEKTFIRILSPKRERGIATLKIGNKLWNYLPKVNKIIKIPPSMMMSSWMGSDFTNDDLVKEYTFVDDYTFSIVERTDKAIKINCTPKKGRPILWKKVLLVVSKKELLPLKEEYYNESNELVRVLNFYDVKFFSGRKVPSKLELVPIRKKGHKTTVEYIELRFNVNIKDSIFTLKNLRKII